MMCYWFLVEVCWCGCGGFVVVVIAIVMVVVMAVVVAVGMRKCFPAWKMHNTFSKKCFVEKRESVKKYLTKWMGFNS